jgi:3-hydroxybutyryl-CoA dehydrogenase
MPDIAVIGTTPDAARLLGMLQSSGLAVASAEDATAAVSSCAVAFEVSADADVAAKRMRLAELERVLPAAAVIATSVDLTSVTQLAEQAVVPSRLVGVHWVRRGGGDGIFELVSVESAARDALERVSSTFAEAGLDTIEVKDRPGLLLDALHLPFLNQAIQSLDDGLATAQDLDLSAELGLGHAVGALSTVDRWGLAAYAERAAALFDETGDTHFAPPPMVRRVLEASADLSRIPPLNEGASPA